MTRNEFRFTTPRRHSLVLASFVALSLFAVVERAHGEKIASYNLDYAFSLSPGNQLVSFPQWNPALYPSGHLDAVRVILQTTVQGKVSAENNTASAGAITVTLNGSISVTLPSSFANTTSVTTSVGPVPVTASDGVPGAGSDYFNLGTMSRSGSTENTLTTNLTPYIGTGTIFETVNGTGQFSATGVASTILNVSDFQAGGTLYVQYMYTAVPEPSSCALACVGVAIVGGCLGRCRRRNV
jgi:hypothetical protein